MSKAAVIRDIGIFLIGVAACISASAYMNKYSARFEIVQLGTMRADQFLLDKGSGRIWRNVCFGEGAGIVCKGRNMWEEMFVSDITPQESPATADINDFIDEQAKKHKK